MPEYALRDRMELDVAGGYFSRHMSAMTGEELHGKSEIASELAWRDWQIDKLRSAIMVVERRFSKKCDSTCMFAEDLDALKAARIILA